jgi:hypothetical protein
LIKFTQELGLPILLRYTSTSSFDSSVLTGVNKRLKLGRLVKEDVSLEPVRDGVLDLVGGELAGRDLEDKVHLPARRHIWRSATRIIE